MYIPNVAAKYAPVFLAQLLLVEEHDALEKEQKHSDISVWVGIRQSHALWWGTFSPGPGANKVKSYNSGSCAEGAVADKAAESDASRRIGLILSEGENSSSPAMWVNWRLTCRPNKGSVPCFSHETHRASLNAPRNEELSWKVERLSLADSTPSSHVELFLPIFFFFTLSVNQVPKEC